MPALSQQPAFLFEDDVFSSRLLVAVVDKQDFHEYVAVDGVKT
jgi:hypothetical protein